MPVELPAGVVSAAGVDVVARSVTVKPSGPYTASPDPFAAGTFGGKVAVNGSQAFTNYRPQSISTASGNPGGSGVQHAPFGEAVTEQNFIDTSDPGIFFGYNTTGALAVKLVATEPQLRLGIEADYNDGTVHNAEIYLDYTSPDSLISFRPFQFKIDRSQAGAVNKNKALTGMFISGFPFNVVSPDGTVNFRVNATDQVGLPGQSNFYPGTTGAVNTLITLNAKTGQVPAVQLRVNDVEVGGWTLATGGPVAAYLRVSGVNVMTLFSTGTGGKVAINNNNNGAGLTVAGGVAFNALPSLVALASASQTGDLFQAQDSGNIPHFSVTVAGLPKIAAAGDEATGAGTPLFGTNSPAVTNAAPYKWFKFISSDGSACYVPAWK